MKLSIRRIVAVTSGLLGVCGLAVAVFAPQLGVLAREGFPAAIGPAKGQFFPVPGARQPGPRPMAQAPLPLAAQARFDQSGGRALLVWQKGHLRHAAYGTDIGPDTLLNSYSLVKTLVGALVLRAHADGRIDTLDLSLDAVIGPQAPQVSVRDALTMTTGLSLRGDPPKASAPKPFDDAGFSAFGPVARLHAFGIDRAVPNIERHPDLAGQFRYQSVNTALLGLVLEQAYQRPLPEILDDLIWRPAGAASARWRRPPGASRVSAYCCLYARAWDWLQVGRFLLNNGTAEAPFLPDDLWQSWILPDLDPATRRKGHYGLHIRHDVLDRDGEDVQGPFAYLAGHGGQIVYLLPRHDAVVVRFGDTPQRLHSTLYDVLGPP